MDGAFSNLGKNIVQTAKLAVAVHLRELFLREAARQRIEQMTAESQTGDSRPETHGEGK